MTPGAALLVAGAALLIATRSSGTPRTSQGWVDVMAGRYFSFRELSRKRDGTHFTLPPDVATALRLLVVNVLDPLRESVGAPLPVTSGFRSDEYNATVPGSAEHSQHERGEAADIAPPAGWDSVKLVQRAMDLGLPFDQIIAYAPARGGHVHVSHKPGGPQRGQVLYAPASGGYTSGLPTGAA